MIRTLQKHGNSKALLIEKPLLDQLGVGEDGKVVVTVSNGSLIVTGAVGDTIPDEDFQKLKKRVLKKLAPTLKALA